MFRVKLASIGFCSASVKDDTPGCAIGGCLPERHECRDRAVIFTQLSKKLGLDVARVVGSFYDFYESSRL